MNELRQKDLRAALEFLHETGAAQDLAQFQACVPRALRRLIPSEHAHYNIFSGGIFTVVTDPPLDTLPGTRLAREWYNAHFAQMQAEHPLIQGFRKVPAGSAIQFSDFLTLREYHRLALYNEALRHADTNHMMGIEISVSREGYIGIAVDRTHRNFSERERTILESLRPHLVQMDLHARTMSRLRRETALAAGAVGQAPLGVLTLCRHGLIHATTPRAEELLDRYFGTPPRPAWSQLPDDLARWVRHEEQGEGRTDDSQAPRTPLIVERDGTLLLVWRVTQPGARLLLLDERITALAPKALRPASLTQRQTDVLILAVQGRTNAEIASELGMRPRTVDKHLEQVYEKLRATPRLLAVSHALKMLSLRNQ